MALLQKEDVPPRQEKKVGIAYNLKKDIASGTDDSQAEYDSIDTVNSIKSVLEKVGYSVILIEADVFFVEKIKRLRPDIIFNIAEGRNGRGREGQVPAILSFLDIPYSGSDETTLCITLDKTITKDYLNNFCVLSPKSQTFNSTSDLKNCNLNFPVIVKPNSEGSSKGIRDVSIAKNLQEINLLKQHTSAYGISFIAEEYIEGREFTVGIIGNGTETHVFEPMEIEFKTKQQYTIYSYEVKQDYTKHVEYVCPANIRKQLSDKIKAISLKIYNSLSCRDFSRIDFRIDKNENVYFIEINPLPGLARGYSDFPMLAEKCGVSYDELVLKILDSAIKRYN